MHPPCIFASINCIFSKCCCTIYNKGTCISHTFKLLQHNINHVHIYFVMEMNLYEHTAQTITLSITSTAGIT